MRIALVAPLYESVPPQRYGGTERVIAALANCLVDFGHEVTLFAAGGSHTRARLAQVVPAPLRTTMTRAELADVAPHLHLQMLAEVYRSGRDFDIVHAHTDIWTLPFVDRASAPTVVTMHGRLDLDVLQRVFPLYPGVPLVSISEAQRAPLDHFPISWTDTVYNGLDLDAYLHEPVAAGCDYLAFVGRITPEKRPDLAVEVARRSGYPLRVAAKIDPLDEEYWRDEIRDLFRRENVEFLGELGEADKPAFLAGARALLFPIDWPEPFGLVMIESMAAGTPVIALRRGSVPEVVKHGDTGWICDDIDQMVHAVEAADSISSDACRQQARSFSARRMARDYVRVYEQVIASHRGSGPVMAADPATRWDG